MENQNIINQINFLQDQIESNQDLVVALAHAQDQDTFAGIIHNLDAEISNEVINTFYSNFVEYSSAVSEGELTEDVLDNVCGGFAISATVAWALTTAVLALATWGWANGVKAGKEEYCSDPQNSNKKVCK